MELVIEPDWLDIVGNLQPLGQIEFWGLFVISLDVLPVSVEESLEAIAAAQHVSGQQFRDPFFFFFMKERLGIRPGRAVQIKKSDDLSGTHKGTFADV